jgi:hypothetical protein
MPVRVHLLASPVDALSTRLGAPDIAPIFDEVNEIWSQACIRFVVGDIVSETVPGSAGAVFETAVSTGDKEEVAKALAKVVPKQAMLERGVDVFVVKSFGIGALGRYFENLDSVVWADTRPDGKRTASSILAHEFGHSMSLQHYEGASAETNLMQAGAPPGDAGAVVKDPNLARKLEAAQIAAARAQAAKGDAF